MLIAQIQPPDDSHTGDWYYRTHAPGRALATLPGVTVLSLSNIHRARARVLAEADVVVINMVCDPDLLPAIADRQRSGLITVFELNDDVSCLQPWNPLADFYARPDQQTLFRMLVKACDGVQFCTPELKRRYQRWARRAVVLPNQVSHPLLPPRPGVPGQMVIGWGGSYGHRGDLEAVAPVVIGFLAANPGVRFHFMGDERLWNLFAVVPAAQKRRFASADIDGYYAFVRTLDVGLAPLLDTGFNRARSDVKALEYAAGGAVPVVADLSPYDAAVVHGESGLRFGAPDELGPCLQRLVGDPNLRLRLAQVAHAYVARDRQEAAHAVHRLEFYESLGARASGDPAAWANEEAAQVEGRHITLRPGRYEKTLMAPMVASGQPLTRKEALEQLAAAEALNPSGYHAALFAAAFAPDKRPLLQRAVAQGPQSLSAWMELGDAHLAYLEPAAALKAYLGAARLSPGYARAYDGLATALRTLGDETKAAHFEALAAQARAPFLGAVD